MPLQENQSKQTSPNTELPSWNDGPVRKSILDFIARGDHRRRSDVRSGLRADRRVRQRRYLVVRAADAGPSFFTFDRARIPRPSSRVARSGAVQSFLTNERTPSPSSDGAASCNCSSITHSGTTPTEFERVAKTWLGAARHPKWKRPFTSCTYQPKLELLRCCARNSFEMFIVSAGGSRLHPLVRRRPYGIPPEHVIGSSGKTRFETDGTDAKLVKLAEVETFDDREAKPMTSVSTSAAPDLAFGNSDGDMAMLHYAASGTARGWRCSSITTTPSASTRTIATSRSAGSTQAWKKQRRAAGW